MEGNNHFGSTPHPNPLPQGERETLSDPRRAGYHFSECLPDRAGQSGFRPGRSGARLAFVFGARTLLGGLLLLLLLVFGLLGRSDLRTRLGELRGVMAGGDPGLRD